MYTTFYQWNRTVAWAATGAAATVPASTATWNSTADNSASWTVTSPTGRGPCPVDWRLPSQAEFQALHGAGGSVTHDGTQRNTQAQCDAAPQHCGGMWAAAATRGNAVAGRFYGPRASVCTLVPADMSGCIFLPAVGLRNASDGTLTGQGIRGVYWSSLQSSITNGFHLGFRSADSYIISTSDGKALSLSIRCVR